MQCDNSESRILAGGCYRREATQKVVVRYSHCEVDGLDLCADCAEPIAKDARRHGYKVTRRAIA